MMQWLNQSLNVVVNHSNRSGSAKIPNETLVASYISATAASVGSALSFNGTTRKQPSLFGRFVPFVAVAAGNALILIYQ